MPPVECTSLGSGAEAPHYLALALSPLVEDYHFLDYQPMMYQREILLTSAALPDSPNPLVSTKLCCLLFLYTIFLLENIFYLDTIKKKL